MEYNEAIDLAEHLQIDISDCNKNEECIINKVKKYMNHLKEKKLKNPNQHHKSISIELKEIFQEVYTLLKNLDFILTSYNLSKLDGTGIGIKNITAFKNFYESENLNSFFKLKNEDELFTLLLRIGMVKEFIEDFSISLREITQKKKINNRQGIDYHLYFMGKELYEITKNLYGLSDKDAEKQILEKKLESRQENLKKLELEYIEMKNKNEISNSKLTLKEEEILKEKKEKEDLNKKIEEYEQYILETEKINLAISKLKEPAQELKKEKEYNLERRDYFNKTSQTLINISGAFFGLFVVFVYVVNLFNIGENKLENVSLSMYIFTIFPILFPVILGLLFLRQANIKSKEIKEIDKRFILIHEVNQSLSALVEINRGKIIDAKTEKVIDKLIENILNYATNENSKDTEANSILNINTKLDQIIDSLGKKKSIFEVTSS